MQERDDYILAPFFSIPRKAKAKPKKKVYRDAARKRVIAEMVKHGISVPEDYDKWTDIDSPKGKVFCANDCHTLIAGGSYRYTLEDIKCGLEDCPDGADCEICNE